MWKYVSPGPSVPRVRDMDEWPPVIVGWYDGPEVDELPPAAEHGECVRYEGRLYVWSEGAGSPSAQE
ncbi:MAG: hypothetical protein LC118_13210 [Dehalococcoidia bacterium]|nr:hypothetical protein [Dehalococcoidia bacterium]